MLFLSLLNNITLLVTLGIVHSVILRRWRQGSYPYQVLAGLIFGVVAVVGMLNSVKLAPGVVFDGRSIIISVAGLFGGPITALITVILAASYRIYMGGAGAIMGVSVITESAIIGVFFHYLRRRWPNIMHWPQLLAMAVAVHVVMLLLTATLPGAVSSQVFTKIAGPVIIIYPFASLLLCLLFLDQESRVHAEEALRRSEENYRALVENANSIIARWKPDGTITFVNEFGLRFFGYREDELIGHSLVETWLPQLESPGRIIDMAMLTNIVRDPTHYQNIEFENVCRDGRHVWVQWTNKAMCDLTGRPVEFLSVGTDITERKKAEAERRDLEDRLLQSQKMEAIGLLAGGVAHDLNNLLSPILGYTGLLLMDGKLRDEHRRDIEEMQKAAERARDLIRQLMAFGRKQTLEVKPLDLNVTIQEFRRLLRRALREDVQLRFEPGLDVPMVKADRGQLEQVLMNLSVNGQDAMPQGGQLTIRTGRIDFNEPGAPAPPETLVPGSYATLSIRDTGVGMSEETCKRIFEPFFTTKKLGEGAGLGLATVYGIVQQHRGLILVTSEMGKGTTFMVYLPAAEEDAVEVIPHLAPITGMPGGNEQLLLAEDSPVVRDMVAAMLKPLGYHVVCSGTAPECLEAVRDPSVKVDLLVTDVVMPEMSGKELYLRLRELRPNARVLFMSGYTADIIADRGVLEEGVEFLAKPFTQPALAQAIRRVLDS